MHYEILSTTTNTLLNVISELLSETKWQVKKP